MLNPGICVLLHLSSILSAKAAEMEQLRAPAALAEDHSPVPSTMSCGSQLVTPTPQDPASSLASMGICTHMHMSTQRHVFGEKHKKKIK